jgi:hypothetical protein
MLLCGSVLLLVLANDNSQGQDAMRQASVVMMILNGMLTRLRYLVV